MIHLISYLSSPDPVAMILFSSCKLLATCLGHSNSLLTCCKSFCKTLTFSIKAPFSLCGDRQKQYNDKLTANGCCWRPCYEIFKLTLEQTDKAVFNLRLFHNHNSADGELIMFTQQQELSPGSAQ